MNRQELTLSYSLATLLLTSKKERRKELSQKHVTTDNTKTMSASTHEAFSSLLSIWVVTFEFELSEHFLR
jgi:hypothetical protein